MSQVGPLLLVQMISFKKNTWKASMTNKHDFDQMPSFNLQLAKQLSDQQGYNRNQLIFSKVAIMIAIFCTIFRGAQC